MLNERVVGLPEVDEFREIVELKNKVLQTIKFSLFFVVFVLLCKKIPQMFDYRIFEVNL